MLLIAGYGGHAGYTYSIASELVKQGFSENIILIAEEYGFLSDKFRGLGEAYSQVLPRKPGEPLYRGLNRWIKAFQQSLALIKKYNFKTVFASGSNFSIPPCIVTRFLQGSKLYTLEAIEHFTKPSRAVKILEKMNAKVFLHWNEQLEMFPRGIVTGPVYEPPIYQPRDYGYILVTTGTLGYRELYSALEYLKLENIVLQTGDIDPDYYIKKNPTWIVFKYTSDIHKWIAGAGLVITHQGVTAATASLAYNKPTIIVWNPRVRLGATREDVEKYAEKLGAVFLREVNVNNLKKSIDNISKPSRTYPSGAERIAKILLEDYVENNPSYNVA